MSTPPAYAGLPRTDGVDLPHTWALRTLAGPSRALVRARFAVEVHGAEHFPLDGPVIVAANHTGVLDGPLMAMFAPRPLHALTKREMFAHRATAFLLRQAGQVPTSRRHPDPAALKVATAVLRRGGAVGIFPEGTRGAGEMLSAMGGVGYLALVTGAPVLPLAFLGTRLRGGTMNSVPHAGSRFVLQYAEPLRFDPRPWPRRPADVEAVTEEVRAALAGAVRRAERRTGIETPGPVPDPLTKEEL